MAAACDRLKIRSEGIDGKVMKDDIMYVVYNDSLKRVVWAGRVELDLLKPSRDVRLTSIIADLLDSDTAEHLINQIHTKFPGDGVFYPWHQDSTHRRYGTPEWIDVNGKGSYVQTAIAIDAMTQESGPLQFIPESCRLGHLGLTYRYEEVDVSQYKLGEPTTVLADPGDLIIFHPFVLHKSDPNIGTTPRRILINGYGIPGANQRVFTIPKAGELIDLL